MEVFSIHLIVKNYSMHHLTPLMETWLGKEGFAVSVLANRVDGTKKTGFFSSESISIFFEDHPDGCLVRMQGSTDICKRVEEYLSQLPPRKITPKRIEVVKYDIAASFSFDKEGAVLIHCPYCHAPNTQEEKTSSVKCPACGKTYAVPKKILDLI